MVRSVLVLLALVSAPAWAVGERISLPKGGGAYAEQLKETLCISMECGTTGTDASISAKVIKGNKVELKVFSPSGALKATVTAPLNDEGRINSMDLVAATSGLIAGIEGHEPANTVKEAAPAPAAKSKKSLAAKAKKKSGFRVAAKGRSGHSRG